MPPTGWNIVACWSMMSSNSTPFHRSSSSSNDSGSGSFGVPGSRPAPRGTAYPERDEPLYSLSGVRSPYCFRKSIMRSLSCAVSSRSSAPWSIAFASNSETAPRVSLTAWRSRIGLPPFAPGFDSIALREVLISTSSAMPNSRQYPSTVWCWLGRRAGPAFQYKPSSNSQVCELPSFRSMRVPLRTVQLRPPARARASSSVTA